MNNIPIFKAEMDAGLADKIQANASIGYLCPIQKFDIPDVLKASIDSAILSVAGKDDPDLYHTLSILVTTSWNKNDDVFDRSEVWTARHTPEHKQTNINHDDDKIVGHIIGNWPVNMDNQLLDSALTIDELPDTFHLLTASVIYKQRSNPETKAEVDELISKIDAGEKFVSMECLFRGFDYAISCADGTKHVVTRNSTSAFLTKHLRSYGGTGEYEDYKVGRLLRHITFSGKGFVDRPANDFSIIFNKDELKDFNCVEQSNPFNINGVILTSNGFFNKEEITNMSDNATHLESQISELKASLKELQNSNADLKTKLSQADVKKFEEKIQTLTTAKETLESDLSVSKDELKVTKKEVTDIQTKLQDATEANTKLQEDLDKIQLASVVTDRISTLVAGGVDKKVAETKVATYAGLSDEQFAEIAKDIIKVVSVAAETVKDDKDDSEDDSKASDDTQVLDTAKPNDEPALASDSEDDSDDSLKTARAGLASWVTTNVLNDSEGE